MRAGGERHPGEPGDGGHREGVAGHLLNSLVAVHRRDGDEVDLRVAVRKEQGDGVIVAGVAVQDDLPRHSKTIYECEVHIGKVAAMAFDDAVKGDDPLERGRARIDWIRSRMPLLAATRAEFSDTRPFHGHRIGMALHLEPKTAVLLETLAAGGAELVVTGNHGSTQDDIAAVLRADGMTVFGSRGDTLEQHHDNVEAVLDQLPDLLLDNGGDLAAGSILRGADSRVIGGTEETTSGGDRLRGVLAGRVPFPVIVINDSRLKAVGENTHAVGQSIVESFMRLTNLMIPGRRFVVVGYGYCGRGIARYLKAFGAQVAVVEVDEIAAFEAAMDGYRVAPLVDVAGWADAIVTATGRPEVVGPDIFPLLRDGAILANSGHFSWEIDVPALRRAATSILSLIHI